MGGPIKQWQPFQRAQHCNAGVSQPVEVIFIKTSFHLPGASLRRSSVAVGEEGCGGSCFPPLPEGSRRSCVCRWICHFFTAPASSSPCRSEIINVSVVGSSLYCVGPQPPCMFHQRPLNHSVRTVAVTDISPPHHCRGHKGKTKASQENIHSHNGTVNWEYWR